ncbi:MAG: hypothetical protein HN407_01895 [Chloroflexi bacterium]|nr:hypothetical protein [Chloroflexota bacterium]
MAIAKLFVLFGHIIVILFVSVRLDRAGMSRKTSMFVAFALGGLLFGSITALISSPEAREIVNPFGAWLGDWLYNNWDPALNDPTIDREPSIPWTMLIPQTYIFSTALAYGAFGSLTWLSGLFGIFDPRNFVGRIPDMDGVLEDETEDQSTSQTDSDPDAKEPPAYPGA